MPDFFTDFSKRFISQFSPRLYEIEFCTILLNKYYAGAFVMKKTSGHVLRLYFLFLLGLFGLFLSCPQREEQAPPEEPALIEPEPDFLTIVAAGDNLFHDTILKSSLKNGTYNFEPLYAEIKDFIEPADIAFINQETPLGGKDFGFSGYPRFNTPQEVGGALVSAGFNVVNHATNHIMDKGEAAVLATMDYWDSVPGIVYLGIHRSEESRNTKKVIVEKNGIKTGFLAYTYGTNGLPVPRNKPYLVSLIDTDVMAREIDALRPLCDFLVVSMHWGNEYQHVQSKQQEELGRFLAEHDVDLVIGHHPHVIQPFIYIPRPGGKSMLCFYSLGNFISAQIRTSTLVGGLLYLRLKKDASGLSVERAGVIPTVTHYEKGFAGYRIYPLAAYSPELADRHGKKSSDKNISPDYFTALAQKVFGPGLIQNNPFHSLEDRYDRTAKTF
jgi:poly-gamma-glutamate synthesis protein (capsule biosynthesis protein)